VSSIVKKKKPSRPPPKHSVLKRLGMAQGNSVVAREVRITLSTPPWSKDNDDKYAT